MLLPLTFGSLFSGIGGFDLGLERSGMVCMWQVEINLFCQKVLEKHWPGVKRFGDIRKCGKHNLIPVDVICGGFPCQPHSLAGKRGGAADDRDLWPEYRRVVEELRPNWVIAENVPGIRGTILDSVLSDLEALDYEVGTLVLPACGFGAPHKRERVWIVAYTTGPRRKGSKGNGEYLQPESLLSTRPSNSGIVAYPSQQLLDRGGTTGPGRWRQSSNGGWWDSEPNVGRVANGIPARVDRLRALGNAVVPQVVEWLGKKIIEIDKYIESDYVGKNENRDR